MIIAIILVIVLFSALVLLHEWGHFIAARRNGVEVDEFGIGFPPRAFGRQIGRTLYSVNWLPLGGFVRMRGEDGTDTSPGSFGGASIWIKTKILLAGVGMNALTAYVLLVILCAWGLPAIFVDGFSLPAPSSTTPQRVMLVDIVKGTPADHAGLHKGDVLVSGNGQSLASETDLQSFTKAHASQTVSLVVKHGSSERTVTATLQSAEQAKDTGYLGVTPLAIKEYRYGIRAPLVAASLFGQLVWGTLDGIYQTIRGLFVHTTGQAIAVTGPVGIVVIMSNILYLGLRYLLFFIATVSVSLALVNALPFPALDGGRLFLIWVGKLRGRPITPELEARIHAAGFAILLLLMAVLTVVDIRRLG